MKFIFIDTNIWVRVISQGKPGCEITHLEELQKLIEEEKIALLLPEIVQLELEKNWRSFTKTVTTKLGVLEKELKEPLHRTLWSEIADVQKALRDFLAEQREKKITDAEERYTRVTKLLESPQVHALPFTQEINLRGRKRLMAGRMPGEDNGSHSDACIIESLAEFLSRADGADHELYFCSENVADFCLPVKDRPILDPLLRDGLPAATEYFTTLGQAIEFYKSNQKVEEPSPATIEEGLRQRTEDDIEAAYESEKERGYDFVDLFTEKLGRMSPSEHASLMKKIDSVLSTLTYREREIIKLRYGLGDGYVYTPAECGRVFKITPQRIRQIEAKAIRKLQHPIRLRQLESIFGEFRQE